MSGNTQGREQLVTEAMNLAVDDILALCYRFSKSTERLHLYTDVLRRQGGQRAQFASCLICFDLARQGHRGFQSEFILLADTMRELATNSELVNSLIGEDPYLRLVWELCQTSLNEMDPRVYGGHLFDDTFTSSDENEELFCFDLFDDDDFEDSHFDISPKKSELWHEFDQAVEHFLGGATGVPMYDPNAGFRLHTSRDIERVERFIRTLDSLREYIPIARGFRALTLLFYGTHLRSRSLFGAINRRKEALLRAGLEEFLSSAPEIWRIAAVVGPLHAAPDTWSRMVDVVSDFVGWLSESEENRHAGADSYQVVERLIARQHASNYRRAGIRLT